MHQTLRRPIRIGLWIVLLGSASAGTAQRLQPDPKRDSLVAEKNYHLTATGITIPAGFIIYGALALNKNTPMYKLNQSTSHEIKEDHPHFASNMDNYLKYAPAVATVALEAAGVKGAHTASQTAVLYGMSYTIMAISTETVKHLTHETRPDGSDQLSFPSGHTATAFASAELMRLEYKDTHPWLSMSGYVAATATGLLRMYKQRHYAGDVVAGAGVGILSTEAAYLLYPVMRRVFSPNKQEIKMTLLPTYDAQWHSAGLSFAYHL